jgi:cobalt-zinc-cadmium efflux system membrane fusion protein
MIRQLLCVSLVLVAGCGGRAPSGDGEPPAAAESRLDRELRIPPETLKTWGVTTGAPQRVTVTADMTLPGVLGLNQQRSAFITALLDGKVVSVKADLGDVVASDQVLAVLHAPAFALAQTAYLQAHARRALTQREYERATQLLRDEAIQQKELLRRQAEFAAATTDVGLAESGLHTLGWDHPRIDALIRRATNPTADMSDLVEPYLDVRSPVAGRVIVRDVMVGEQVHPDKALFTVSNLDTLWALLDARETDLPLLKTGDGVTVATQVYPGRSFPGRITRIGDVVDEKLRTIKVRVDVPNPGGLLRPNMYIQGTIKPSGGERDVLSVPEDAVQSIEGSPAVFVTGAGQSFTIRRIEIGDLVGGRRVIRQGLRETDTVVLTGAFNLKAELLKPTFAGGE